jgi:ATP-dependent DNA helicase RecG
MRKGRIVQSDAGTIIDALAGPLAEEAKRGYDDGSVIGGFGRFVHTRLAASNSPFAEKFATYAELSPGERKKLVASLVGGKKSSAVNGNGKLPETQVVAKATLASPLRQLAQLSRGQLMAFSRQGIKSVAELIAYYPRWPLHHTWFKPIAEAKDECLMLCQINGWEVKRKGRLMILRANLVDASGFFSWTWFNQPYMKDDMVNGRWVVVRGKIEKTPFGPQVSGKSGNYVFLEDREAKDLKAGRLVLRYHTTGTLGQALLEKLIKQALKSCDEELVENLPDRLNSGLPPRKQALQLIHTGSDPIAWEKARQRLALEELFYLQAYLGLRCRALGAKDKKRKYRLDGEKVSNYLSGLKFSLTGAQTRCLEEIRKDLAKRGPMNRLLQGDVGSGKTVLAAVALLSAVDSGCQAAIMAPTEILAEQHYRTMKGDMERLGLEIELLTSALGAKKKRQVYADLADGSCRLVVGTHALFQDEVKFKELGLVVVDERHKFGVEQRARLEMKGDYPDCLMMTATPLPRAIVLTLYGDTDISILDEMPPGRGQIKTKWINTNQRSGVYDSFRQRLDAGEQGYIVVPLVDESEKLNLKAATAMFEQLSEGELKGYRIGLVHGKLRSSEKEAVMSEFRSGRIQALVATTVIEVGIDVASATVLVVENAERFGLSQLHQLRGRIGRGKRESFCYLLGEWGMTSEAKSRLRAMTKHSDGFRLAEEDLRLRGPGELFGTRQSGYTPTMVVDLKRDGELVEEARQVVAEMLAVDPLMEEKRTMPFREELRRRFKEEMEMVTLS